MRKLNRIVGAALSLAFLLSACQGPGKEAVVDEGALGPYSSAVLSGDYCFVSGKIGERGGTFENEVNTAIDAIEETLAKVGLDLSHVVVATVYLTDMSMYPRVNAVYGERFPAPYPARACVAVKELPAGAQVEIMVTAHR